MPKDQKTRKRARPAAQAPATTGKGKLHRRPAAPKKAAKAAKAGEAGKSRKPASPAKAAGRPAPRQRSTTGKRRGGADPGTDGVAMPHQPLQ
jgi:hypothetical protein